MRGSGDPGGESHAGREARQRDEAPAVERQVDDLPVVDDVPEPGRLAAQQRRVGRDRDRFGHTAELQPKIESNGFSRGEPYAVARERPEAAQLDANLIGARREPWIDVAAVRAGDRRARQVRANASCRHRRARHGRARLIRDVTYQRAAADLTRRRGSDPQPPQPPHTQTRQVSSSHPTSRASDCRSD